MKLPSLLPFGSICLFVFFLLACGPAKQESDQASQPADILKGFVQQFKQSLSAEEDKKLLGMLKLERSQEALTELVKVLKNSHHSIRCEFDFNRTTFQELSENKLQVWLPISLVNGNFPNQEPDTFIISAKVERLGNSFVIREMDADLLYYKFNAFQNRNFWALELEAEFEKRRTVYELVNKLQTGVDSVIWFTRYQDRLYFYFVEGEWLNPKTFDNPETEDDPRVQNMGTYKMGLLDADGQVVIPADYDLIGTLGFDVENLVEVKRNGKYGMYHIQSKLPVIPATYDVLIPYKAEDKRLLIITQEGNQTGYFNSDFLHFEGLPAVQKIDQFLANYQYLDKGLVIKNGNQAMLEIPKKEYLGNGYVVPPSYLTNLHVMDSIEFGFTTTRFGENAGHESREFLGVGWQKISDTFNALMVLVKDHYMHGREEFYLVNRVAVIDRENKARSSADYGGGDLLSLRFFPDLGYYEGKSSHAYDLWDVDVHETGLHNYYYFSIDQDGQLRNLNSRRVFDETKFAKMDSSYLTGNFSLFLADDKIVKTNFLSEPTIQYFLDEILADNGYVFPDEGREIYFYHLRDRDKEQLPILTLEQAMANFSDIDRHNYAFLSSLLPKKTLASK